MYTRCEGELSHRDNLEDVQRDYTCGVIAIHYALLTLSGSSNIKQVNANLESRLDSNNALSLLDLKKYLQENGINALGLNCGVEYLQEIECGILVLNSTRPDDPKHFVFFRKELSSGKLLLADPQQNSHLQRVTTDSLKGTFSGSVLVLQKS